MRLAVLVACLFVSTSVDAATLYVDVATGSDATSKASNTALAPWASIYRAVKGCALASAPCSSAGEAASAGDVVLVTDGTYVYAGASVEASWSILYNPVNEGSAGNLITITCTGTCVIDAKTAFAAAIGSDGRDYVKWYADVTAGHAWVVDTCALTTAPTGCSGDYISVPAGGNAPVIMHAAVGVWIEGVEIDGGPAIDWTDNWSGVRTEGCDQCTARNLLIRNITKSAGEGGTTHNQSGFTHYGTSNSLFEHNDIGTVGSCHFFKDTGSQPGQEGNTIRLTTCDEADSGVSWSILTPAAAPEGRNFVYHNVLIANAFCIELLSDLDQGPQDDWIYNNTCILGDASGTAVRLNGSAAVMTGIKIWNLIVSGFTTVMLTNQAAWPSTTVISSEHSVYFGFTAGTFISDSGGNDTFANFKTDTGNDLASPASVTTDPRFVNAGAGDYRICTGVNTPEVGCAGASPAIGLGVNPDTAASTNSGAYETNTECIGLESSCDAPETPSPVRLRITPPDFGLEVR